MNLLVSGVLNFPQSKMDVRMRSRLINLSKMVWGEVGGAEICMVKWKRGVGGVRGRDDDNKDKEDDDGDDDDRT
jgi:hypothetical protein